MATINAPSLQDTQYSGAAPLAVAHGYTLLAAAAIADKVRLVKLYAGTKVHAIKLVNAALGAGTTVALGYEYVNGESGGAANALLAAASTVAAAATHGAGAPVVLAYDAYITMFQVPGSPGKVMAMSKKSLHPKPSCCCNTPVSGRWPTRPTPTCLTHRSRSASRTRMVRLKRSMSMH